MDIYHYLPISYLTANNNNSNKITSLTEKVSHRSLTIRSGYYKSNVLFHFIVFYNLENETY